MSQELKQCIIDGMTLLAEKFRQSPSEITHKAYFMALRDLPIPRLVEAFMKGTQCKFFPSSSELRELAGVAPPEHKANLAWEVLQRAMKLAGCYKSVHFQDRALNATVHVLGGWARLFAIPDDEFFRFIPGRFKEIYCGFVRAGVPEHLTTPMLSETDAQNAANGYGTRPPMLIASATPDVVPLLPGVPLRAMEGEPIILPMLKDANEVKHA